MVYDKFASTFGQPETKKHPIAQLFERLSDLNSRMPTDMRIPSRYFEIDEDKLLKGVGEGYNDWHKTLHVELPFSGLTKAYAWMIFEGKHVPTQQTLPSDAIPAVRDWMIHPNTYPYTPGIWLIDFSVVDVDSEVGYNVRSARRFHSKAYLLGIEIFTALALIGLDLVGGLDETTTSEINLAGLDIERGSDSEFVPRIWRDSTTRSVHLGARPSNVPSKRSVIPIAKQVKQLVEFK